jgi:hypothetical protein
VIQISRFKHLNSTQLLLRFRGRLEPSGIKPLKIRYHEKGHRHMTFDPAEFKKCVQENLGTNAPIVNAAGERIGVLPTDVIQRYLVSNV